MNRDGVDAKFFKAGIVGSIFPSFYISLILNTQNFKNDTFDIYKSANDQIFSQHTHQSCYTILQINR